MNTDWTGFYTCKERLKTESPWNHTATDHKEGEQLEDRRNVGESSCRSGDGTDQRVQSLMFIMMIMMYCLLSSRREKENGNGQELSHGYDREFIDCAYVEPTGPRTWSWVYLLCWCKPNWTMDLILTLFCWCKPNLTMDLNLTLLILLM
jgi:hypothetical protein